MRRTAVLPLLLVSALGCNRGRESAATEPAEPPPVEVKPTPVPADPAPKPDAPKPAVSRPADPPPKPRPSADTRRKHGAVIEGWGTVSDTDGDCTIREEKDFVSVAVPATLHDINPTKEGRNAPRILQPIFGDFSAVVRVTGKFEPERPSTSRQSQPFFGAGLVLWEDETNLLILGRNAWLSPNGQYFCFAPLFELFENGRGLPTNPPITLATAFKGESTALFLERKGDTVRGAYSHDGKTWEGWRTTKSKIPKNAKVGVTVLNTSNKPFTVTFDGFKVRQE